MVGRQGLKAARQLSAHTRTSVNLRGAVIIQRLILHCCFVSRSLAEEVDRQWKSYFLRVCSSREITGEQSLQFLVIDISILLNLLNLLRHS